MKAKFNVLKFSPIKMNDKRKKKSLQAWTKLTNIKQKATELLYRKGTTQTSTADETTQ